MFPATAHAGSRRFVAYYVRWDPRAWQSLSANWDAVDLVAAQWVWADTCGGLASRDDQTLKAEAARRGVSVMPSLFTFSKTLNHALLTEPTTGTFVDNVLRYVEDE